MSATVHSVATGSSGRGRWVIDNFSNVEFTVDRCDISPVLHMVERNWTLLLYAGGVAAEDGPPKRKAGDFAFYLRLEPGQSEAKARYSIVTSQPEFSHSSQESTFGAEFRAHGQRFTSASWKTQRARLPNDRFVIDVEVFMSGSLVTPSVSAPAAATGATPLRTSLPSHGLCGFAGLSRDLGVLYNTAAGSDVSVMIGDCEYRCHRWLLAARSPVFKAMFASGMKESLSGEVVVEGAVPLAFREFLRFVYTGDCDLSPEPLAAIVALPAARPEGAAAAKDDDDDDAGEEKEEEKGNTGLNVDFVISLLRLADQYQVDDLVRVCGRQLIATLNVTNVLALFRISDHCADLQNACLDLLGRDSRVYKEATRDEAAFNALSAEQLRILLVTIGAGQDSDNKQRHKKRSTAPPHPLPADDDPFLPVRKRGRHDENVLTQEDFNHMPIPALKAELRRRKASVDGNRTSLLLRLISLATATTLSGGP